MTKDITTTEQAIQLLQAGIDPLTCNMLELEGRLIQRADIDYESFAAPIFLLDSDNKADIMGFPKDSFEKQKEYMEKFRVVPLWTSCALMDAIPDSPNQSISLTRGGYDMSRLHDPAEDGYVSDTYFVLYEYEDLERDFYIDHTFGGDSYIEAMINMYIAYLTEIKPQIG